MGAIHKQRAKRLREDPTSQPNLKIGNSTRSATYKQKHAANRQLKRNKHKLVPFEPHWPTWPLKAKMWTDGPVFTCTKCWKFGPYNISAVPCVKRSTFNFHRLDSKSQGLLAKLWNTTVDKASKALATAKKQRLVEQGIEPHPGPSFTNRRGTPTISICSLNAQGCAGAWRALAHLTQQHVFLLQDTPWLPAEFAAFQKAALRSGYNVYWQPGRTNQHRRSGGVTTLVSKQLCQQPMHVPETDHTHTYILAVHVQGFTLLNCYAPPGEQQHMEERLVDTAAVHQMHELPWGLAGDFNEEPSSAGSVAAALHQIGGTSMRTNCSTHWEGSHEIDWFATNRPQWCEEPVVLNDKALSDHKAITLQVTMRQPLPSRCQFKPQPRWHKPVFLEDAQWNRLLGEAWGKLLQQPQSLELATLNANIDVDAEWTNFMTLLSQTYKEATKDSIALAPTEEQAMALRKTLSQPGHANGKGVNPPTIQKYNNTILKASHARASMAERKVVKRLAKLHEFNRLAKKAIRDTDAHYLSECNAQLWSLADKLWPNQLTNNTTLGHLLRQTLTEVPAEQANRRRIDNDNLQRRLTHWREKMGSGQTKNISKWLQHKENPHNNVSITRNGQTFDNNVQAADAIHKHWQQIWEDQTELDPAATATAMMESFGDLQQQQQLDWQPPDFATFAQALWKANGAAGCDSWSSQETTHMPLEAVRHLHKLTLRWHEAHKVPTTLTYGRQATLPKTHKISQGLLAAQDTRPITVLSIYWRAWASAWTQTAACREFASLLPKEIVGVHGHAGCEEATTYLQQQFTARKGVIVTLDYSQCYDRLQVDVATQFLQQLGWPEALVSQLQQVWKTTQCPIAPICLSSVMASGMRAVDALMVSNFGHSVPNSQAANTRIYMDDRSFVDSNLDRTLDRVTTHGQCGAL